MRERRSHNTHLPEPPSREDVLRALAELEADDRRRHEYGATAADVAWRLGVQGASRLGNGAVKGTWSGRMSGALRVAPRLRSLAAEGLVGSYYDERSRRRHVLTRAGRDLVASLG